MNRFAKQRSDLALLNACRERPLWRSMTRGGLAKANSRNATEGVPYRDRSQRQRSTDLISRAFVTRFGALLLAIAADCAAIAGRPLSAADARPSSSDDVSDDRRDEDRQALLDGDEWHDTMHALDEWFTAQPIYTEDEVDRIKVRMRRSIARMSYQELADYKQDLDEKLDILFSPEWRAQMELLSEKLAVAAPSYAKKIGLHYPDVARLSAAQLQKELDSMQAQQAGDQREATAFNQIRRQRVAFAERERQEQNRARTHALDRATAHIGAGAYHSNYHPSRARENPPYLRQSSRIGFGYGFGFW